MRLRIGSRNLLHPSNHGAGFPSEVTLEGLGTWARTSNHTTVSYPQGNPLDGGMGFDCAIATLSKSQIATSADENIDALKDGGTDAKSNLRVRSRHVNRGWVKKN